MMRQAAPRQLPVCLPPVTGELLSSWISRHAAFYAVPPLFMLRHCLPEASSLRAADIHLTGTQIHHLSKMLATKLAAVRRMTFTNVMQSSRRLIATRPLQFCANCMSCRKDPRAILRSQLLGWRITCPSCGDPLRDNGSHEFPSRLLPYRDAALRGERLLDDEVERGFRTWTSPTDIARLLLMRRIPRPLRHEELWRFRVLGAIVPGFDDIVAAEREKLPTPACPIIPLQLRPALLAGVAIVERTGPEMLRMLRGHTMGDNRIRFSHLADRITAQTSQLQALSQMQLI